MNVQHKMVDVHPNSKIANNVEIGSFTSISEDVEIGEGTWIGSNVTIMDGARIGKNCRIFPGAVISAIPQDLKFNGEKSLVEIGDNVTIREYCTVNRGTEALGTTKVGKNSLLMAYVHVAHDCIIGQNCILANAVNMAGHVTVGDFAVIGGMTAIHQFVKIGCHAMISGGSLVRKDVPPYIQAAREPLSYTGINTVGLARRGFNNLDINFIQDLYREFFVKNNNNSQALSYIRKNFKDTPFKSKIISFIEQSERGLLKGFNQ